MNVEPTDERLSAYLDGDLTVDEVTALEHELAHDADLRADLDALRMVVHTLRDEGPVRAPLGFHAAVMDRVEEEHPEAPFWQRFLQRPFGIPAQGWGVVLAAAAVLVVVQMGTDDEPTVDAPDEPVWRELEPEEAAPAAADLPKLKVDKELPAPVKPEAKPVPRPPSKEQGGSQEKPTPDPQLEQLAEEAPPEPADADTGKQALRTSPTGLTLQTKDPAALREVLAMVARFGGTVTTPSGGPVTHATLASAEESVVVKIPSTQLAAFQKALGALGTVKASFDPERLYGGSTLDVPLTFKLVGGSSGTGDEDVPAAAKKRRALDLESVEK